MSRFLFKIPIFSFIWVSVVLNFGVAHGLMNGGAVNNALKDALKERGSDFKISKSNNAQSLLYLEGIFFLDSQDWVVWINGEEYQSAQGLESISFVFPKISFHLVEDQKIYLKVYMEKDSYKILPLYVNQTFDCETLRVQEGDMRHK